MSFCAVSSGFGPGKVVALSACLVLACVNRGMQAPDDAATDRSHTVDARIDRSGTGGVRADATIDQEGTAGARGDAAGVVDALGDSRGATGGSRGNGTGGATGTGGRGSGGTGAGGSIVDAGTPCTARFNFENGNLYGALINNGFQTSFSNLSHASDAACGAGSLHVDVTLSPSSAKGELILPLGATENLAGKTVSLAVKMTPQESPNAYVIVFAVPSYAFITAFSPIPAVWSTSTVTLPSGADAGATATTAISVQIIGQGDTYSGALLLDEVDIR